MERADISVFLCNATKKACQKYGPFICPSELSELINCLPRLFKARDQQIADVGVKMKMPRLTGERNILIVDLPVERNGEINVFAIDDLPAEDIIVPYIGCILEQTSSRDVLSGRTLQTASKEVVDHLVNEEYLKGGILIISPASQVSPLEETPLPNLDHEVQSDTKFNRLPSNSEDDHNAATKIEANSNSRRAQFHELVMNGTSPIEEINDQSGLPGRLSPAAGAGGNSEADLSLASDGQDEVDPIRDIANKSSCSSPTALMPEDFQPLLGDYTSESMDELPEGHKEVNHTTRNELPTAEESINNILGDEVGKERFKHAYYESFIYRERGGWIFVDPDDPAQFEVILAPMSASDTFHATDMTTTPSIDLNNIPTNGVPPGYVLVATFHTHPLYENENPSKADVENAYHRGMPGIVISRTKIFGYGPERRTNTNDPQKYAPPIKEGKSMQSKKLRDNPFPLR